MSYTYSPFGPTTLYRPVGTDQAPYFNTDFLVLNDDNIVFIYEERISVFMTGTFPNSINGFFRPNLVPDHFDSVFPDGLFEHDPSLTLLANGNVLVTWEVAYYSDIPSIADYEVAFAITDAEGNIVAEPQLANNTVTDWQTDSIAQPLEDGGLVIAWNSEAQDGSQSGVFARLFDSDGLAVATEFQVNSQTAGDQILSEVVVGADGRILFAWSSGDEIVLRLYSDTGLPVGAEMSLGTAANPDVSIVALPSGGFIAAVSGDGLDTSGSGIVVHLLSENGASMGPPIEVNTTMTGDQDSPRVLALGDGGFAVFWESEGQDGSGTGIFARIFDASGMPTTDELQINQGTEGDQFDLDAVVLPNGDIVMSWTSEGPNTTIRGRSMTEDGIFLGDEFVASPDLQATPTSSSIQVFPDGRFQITWFTTGYSGASDGGIYGQTFVPDQVSTGIPVVQGVARLGEVLGVDIGMISDPDGLDLTTASYRWLLDGVQVSDQETYTPRPNDAGSTLIVEVTVTDGAGIPQTFTSQPTAPIGSSVFATTGDDDLTGTAGSDFFDGGSGRDIIRGLGGSDTLFGGVDDDYLDGGANNDLLLGEAGNDRLYGATQEDTLFGDDGNDIIFGDAGFDLLVGGAGNDTLNGGAQADVLLAGEGDDLLIGEAGLDHLSGEAGNDTLQGGEGDDALRGGDDDDVLSAGEGNDILYGDTGKDLMQGDGGYDLLVGGVGNDTLAGGGENDTLMGGAGFDLLQGGTGNDELDGGNHADNLYGEGGNDTMNGGFGYDRLFGGAGDDVLFDFRGFGGQFGGSGNDTMTGGADATVFYGESGNDVINAGGGNDRVGGGSGFDLIDGGTGDDTLFGDFNADTFVFSDNHGRDVIGDFDANNPWERLDLRSITAITSYQDMVLNHLSQVGQNAEINTGQGLITLIDVNIADLDQSDFLL